MFKQLPKKFKYGRSFTIDMRVNTSRYCILQYFVLGLVFLEAGDIYYHQVFAIFKLLKKHFKKRVKLKFNISFDIPYTKKSISSRMGKGKGARKGFKALVERGQILVELSGVSFLSGYKALLQGGQRLPLLTKVVKIKI